MASLRRWLFRDSTRSIGWQDFSLVWHSSSFLKPKKGFSRFLCFWQVKESLLESLCKLTHSRLVYLFFPSSQESKRLQSHGGGEGVNGGAKVSWKHVTLSCQHRLFLDPLLFSICHWWQILKGKWRDMRTERWKDKEKSLQRLKRKEWDEKNSDKTCIAWMHCKSILYIVIKHV